MKLVIVLGILVCAEANYPPPNYKSIVKPSSSYFIPVQAEELKITALPHQLSTTAALSVTQKPEIPSNVNPMFSTEKLYLYSGSSTLAPSVASSLSTTYENVIPKVSSTTPQPYPEQHQSTSSSVKTQYEYLLPKGSTLLPEKLSYPAEHEKLYPEHQQPSTNTLCLQSGSSTLAPSVTPSSHSYEYILPKVTTPAPAPYPEQHHQPTSSPVNVEYEYGIPKVTTPASAPYSEQQQPTIPPVKVQYEYIYPKVTASPTPQIHYSVLLPGNQHQQSVQTQYQYNVPNLTAAPSITPSLSMVYGVPQLQNHQAVNPPIQSNYQYIVPHLTPAAPVPQVSKELVSEYGVPQPVQLPIKTNYEYVIPHNPTLGISRGVPPQAANPIIKTYYEYTIPNAATSYKNPSHENQSVGPVVASIAPEYGVPHGTTSAPTKTDYEYVIPQSTPTPQVSILGYKTTPSSEYGIPNEVKNPTKITYEYNIPNKITTASPSTTVVPHAEYGVPQ